MIDSNISSVFERIRETEEFWKIPRNNLNCMANEYGQCTFFVSPGECMWLELGVYIKKVNSCSNDERSISELVAADPVSATTFIYNLFNLVMTYLLSDDNPLAEWLCEYQNWGLPHFHYLFWIANEGVKKFIMEHITCQIPNKASSSEPHKKVMM